MSEDVVVDVAGLGPGEMRAVEAAGLKILICNVEGRYWALEDKCTHAAIPLSAGRLEGCVVACPLHDARFDVTNGSVVQRPAIRPVATFPVSDPVDGQIRIHLARDLPV